MFRNIGFSAILPDFPWTGYWDFPGFLKTSVGTPPTRSRTTTLLDKSIWKGKADNFLIEKAESYLVGNKILS
jgi:hypothetical protein